MKSPKILFNYNVGLARISEKIAGSVYECKRNFVFIFLFQMGPNRFESDQTGETGSCPEEANLPQEILVPQATAAATATATATTATATATAAATATTATATAAAAAAATTEIRSSEGPAPSSPGRHQSH